MSDPIVVECANYSPSWALIGSLIATVIIASITAYVAYLNYCTRPYLLAIKEKHTKELKELLQKWLLFIEQAVPFSLESKTAAIESTPFEDFALFNDLLLCHHSGLGVNQKWIQVKSLSAKFNVTIRELSNTIKRDLNADLGLRQMDLNEGLNKFIYQQSVAIAKGIEPPYSIKDLKIVSLGPQKPEEFVLIIEHIGSVIGRTNYANIQVANDYCKNVLGQLCNSSSKEYKYVEIALRADKLENDLTTEYQELRLLIDEMLAIPIFIDECKHVLRSVPPIFPSRRWFHSKWNKYVTRLYARIGAYLIKSIISRRK